MRRMSHRLEKEKEQCKNCKAFVMFPLQHLHYKKECKESYTEPEIRKLKEASNVRYKNNQKKRIYVHDPEKRRQIHKKNYDPEKRKQIYQKQKLSGASKSKTTRQYNSIERLRPIDSLPLKRDASTEVTQEDIMENLREPLELSQNLAAKEKCHKHVQTRVEQLTSLSNENQYKSNKNSETSFMEELTTKLHSDIDVIYQKIIKETSVALNNIERQPVLQVHKKHIENIKNIINNKMEIIAQEGENFLRKVAVERQKNSTRTEIGTIHIYWESTKNIKSCEINITNTLKKCWYVLPNYSG